jgi:magnesium transporter
MIRAFAAAKDGRLVPSELPQEGLDGLVWIDLLNASPAEEARVEGPLGLDLPTRAEMEEIEPSARLYHEGTAIYMTANLTAKVESERPQIVPVSFVLSQGRLVTVRHDDPMSFSTFPDRAARASLGCGSGEGVLVALLESIVERLADILELCGQKIEAIGRGIFGAARGKRSGRRNLKDTIVDVGQVADMISNVRVCLVTLDRLISFLGQTSQELAIGRDLRARIKSLSRDVRSLGDHTGFLSEKAGFLLDATLGLINIDQSDVMRIFSVVAVIFLPPTLIASCYGMNFANMPELSSPIGYPVVMTVIILSAIVPYLYFRWRNWL